MSSLALHGACSIAPLKAPRPRARQRLATVVKAHTVTLLLPNGKSASFKADKAHSIWEYAKFNNVSLPACCMQGSCTSCVSKVVKGKVDQHSQCCLNAAMTKEGFVALCCAVPLSDVTIQTHQGGAARKMKRELAEAQ